MMMTCEDDGGQLVAGCSDNCAPGTLAGGVYWYDGEAAEDNNRCESG